MQTGTRKLANCGVPVYGKTPQMNHPVACLNNASSTNPIGETIPLGEGWNPTCWSKTMVPGLYKICALCLMLMTSNVAKMVEARFGMKLAIEDLLTSIFGIFFWFSYTFFSSFASCPSNRLIVIWLSARLVFICCPPLPCGQWSMSISTKWARLARRGGSLRIPPLFPSFIPFCSHPTLPQNVHQ